MDTLLRELIRQQHLKYETFRAEYGKAAAEVAPEAVAPSKAQFQRWLAGQLKGGAPYPDACRVLEHMFPPWTAAQLFESYDPGRHLLPPDGDAATGGVLDAVPPSFAADAVVQSQANITCKLLNLYLDGNTVIAEWLAEFDDVAKGERKRMLEIAVLTFKGGLISSLREYWASEALGLLEPSP